MRRSIIHISTFLILLTVTTFFLIISCRPDPSIEVFFQEDELLISTYLEEHADKYSSLIRVLEITDLKNTLNAYGNYTFFAPDNDAFKEFCAQSGKSSVDDFEKEFLVTLVRYHLIDIQIESSYFKDGVITDTTYSGDYLVITFSEGGLDSIHVNESLITERDIHVENGIIHAIDKVLAPKVGSVYDRLNELGEYAIFSRALEICGLADTLDLVRIDLNDDIFIRTRFTLFAESDNIFKLDGVQTAEDLVEKYSDTGDPAGKNDGFYRFMAYHIVPGLYYLNNIDSFNYSTLADNMLINVELDDNIYLNRHMAEEGGQPVEKVITVVEEASNQQAKNGVLHQIDRVMEPWEPEPVYQVIDLTDYQGLSIGQTYTEKELKDIRGISTENTGIYFRNSILNDGETNLQTTSTGIGWSVEFELPPVIRGQYDVYLYWASYQNNSGLVQALWDGSRLGDPISLVHSKRWPGVEWKYDYNTSQWMGRLQFTETRSHTLKFISLKPGWGNFDYLVLSPVEN
jgi:uncharacterized surface protein with fasciclin (FAS1) repeats